MEKQGIEQLIGKTLVSVKEMKDVDYGKTERITFICSDGDKFVMYHDQDCCESVLIDDICGDLADLVGCPILLAREDTNSKENPEGIVKERQDSFTWTFYNIGTTKGNVTIRWYGESNGYYSESVTFKKETSHVKQEEIQARN